MSSPFVPTYRQFPTDDPHNLEKQLVNQASQFGIAINQRIIGSFDTVQIPTGERWFAAQNTKLRDGQRKVFQVSDTVLTVNHGITNISQVTRLYGTFQDAGGNWWPLPYVDVVAANNQINVRVTATQVIVTKGGGAPPAINSGIVVVEWL